MANIPEIMYHWTSRSRLPFILKSGLKINQDPNLSEASLEYIKDIYGMIPIFLSYDYKSNFINEVCLKIDISQFNIVADIPTLISSHGAYMGEDYGSIYFEEDGVPEELIDYLNEDGELSLYDIINYKDISEAIIELTRTCACVENISPEKIDIFNPD